MPPQSCNRLLASRKPAETPPDSPCPRISRSKNAAHILPVCTPSVAAVSTPHSFWERVLARPTPAYHRSSICKRSMFLPTFILSLHICRRLRSSRRHCYSPCKKKRSRYAAKRCLFLVKWENGASFCAGDQDRIFHTQWRIAALRMKRAILYVKSAPIYGLTTGRCFLSGASLRFYVYGKTAMPDNRFAVVGHLCRKAQMWAETCSF